MTSSSSPRHGRDPGLKLIRISPARIQTQVTQTVRYRPVRSLLLLGLLVVISLFVLFTLSQMAVVQHTMMAQLETGRPGGGGGGWAGVSQGGRASRPAQKPWRSQFNQFKIEPLLIRNAPSVEVNTAMAANRRRASQIAAIIVRSSLLVNQLPSLTFTNLTSHQPQSALSTHTPPVPHPTQRLRQAPQPHLSRAENLSNVSLSSLPHESPHLIRGRGSEAITPVTSADRVSSSLDAPSSNHEAPHLLPRHQGNTSMESTTTTPSQNLDRAQNAKESDDESAKKDVDSNSEDRRKTERKNNNNNNNISKNTDKVKQQKPNRSTEKEQAHKISSEKLRRQFFNRLECDSSSGRSECDSKKQFASGDKPGAMKAAAAAAAAAARSARLGNQGAQNPSGNERRSLQAGGSVDRDEKHKGNGQNDDLLLGKRTSDDSHSSKESQMSLEGTVRPDDDETTSGISDVIDKGSGPLPTEFSEAEKDFEPLYLREDEDYDISEEQTTNPATSEPQTPTKKVLTDEQLRKLPTCPEIPPHLMGRLNISLDALEKLRLNEVLKELEWVMPGGTWSPSYEPTNPCLPRHKVAVVLPYRDRLHHLIILLSWLHPILRRQQLEYTIYVAEQSGNATFNKGSIMNAGFMEAWQRSAANCFVFHDVDLLPEDDRNMYSCPPQPRHLSVGVDTLGYKLPYFLLVGGVLSVRGDHFLRLNGYSNMYWGWGGEDDDMGYRIKQSGLSITRPPNMLARYTMIRHLKRRPLTWKVRGKLVRTSGRRYRLDGLNTLKYSLLALHKHPLFTHLLLDVGTPPENLVRLDSH